MKFNSIVIRQASNGYIMSIEPDYRQMEEISLRGHYTPPLDTICADEAAVVEAVRGALNMATLTAPEQPQTPSEGEDSTEAMGRAVKDAMNAHALRPSLPPISNGSAEQE
jgi:hypothetical protein